jgi:hypothetical protein
MLQQASSELFLIRSDDRQYSDQWFVNHPLGVDGAEIDPREFTQGRAYHGVRPAALRIDNPGRQLAFSLGPFGLPVVSEMVAHILRTICLAEVELFSIDIPGARDSYYILNVVRAFKCLDESRSEFTRWQPGDHRSDLVGKYRSVSKVRIDAGQTDDSHIFRIQGSTLDLIVSKELKESLESVPQLGIVFECVT